MQALAAMVGTKRTHSVPPFISHALDLKARTSFHGPRLSLSVAADYIARFYDDNQCLLAQCCYKNIFVQSRDRFFKRAIENKKKGI